MLLVVGWWVFCLLDLAIRAVIKFAVRLLVGEPRLWKNRYNWDGGMSSVDVHGIGFAELIMVSRTDKEASLEWQMIDASDG